MHRSYRSLNTSTLWVSKVKKIFFVINRVISKPNCIVLQSSCHMFCSFNVKPIACEIQFNQSLKEVHQPGENFHRQPSQKYSIIARSEIQMSNILIKLLSFWLKSQLLDTTIKNRWTAQHSYNKFDKENVLPWIEILLLYWFVKLLIETWFHRYPDWHVQVSTL